MWNVTMMYSLIESCLSLSSNYVTLRDLLIYENDGRISVSAAGGRRLWEWRLHPAEATLAQPERTIDDNESTDVVRWSRCRHQDLPEQQCAPDEGLRDADARSMLSNGSIAEGRDDRYAGSDGQEGELRVTLHPPRGLHLQRERTAMNRAVCQSRDSCESRTTQEHLKDVYRILLECFYALRLERLLKGRIVILKLLKNIWDI